MPPKVVKQILFEITSVEHFNEIISEQNKKMSVIDIYLSWCGPCACMENNFRTIFFAHD